jgi:hypothetical protein
MLPNVTNCMEHPGYHVASAVACVVPQCQTSRVTDSGSTWVVIDICCDLSYLNHISLLTPGNSEMPLCEKKDDVEHR